MLTKRDLPQLVLASLERLGGAGTVVEVSREIWANHEKDLRESDDLFYTWQYDVRWAAQRLRNEGALAPTSRGASSRWQIQE